ncbi:hypothetical protein [Gimesia sp.]|uniref:hypothetical protein n=1 Tax=Gimesia sp. TaxID=2024833 RepID=UPI0032EEAF07
MRCDFLCIVLLAVISLTLTPAFESQPMTTAVNPESGEVFQACYDSTGKLHGTCVRRDKYGNLVEEMECVHGHCVSCRQYAASGKLLYEIREDKNFKLVQTYP